MEVTKWLKPSDSVPTTNGRLRCSIPAGSGTPGTSGMFAVFTPRLAR